MNAPVMAQNPDEMQHESREVRGFPLAPSLTPVGRDHLRRPASHLEVDGIRQEQLLMPRAP